MDLQIKKSNSVPQLAESVIIDRNFNEYEVNQKELSQLNKISQKSRASRQNSFNLLPSKTFIQIMCLYCASHRSTRKHFISKNFINRSF